MLYANKINDPIKTNTQNNFIMKVINDTPIAT